ncbi:hypothetical protein SDRG_04849 [Saprolegnia diclina VS20]|uniref:PLAC8 family protein n=1 Tax=Saprolegnia diclina (strain VS20) TaxID=1156394 RepID=T0QUV9_SAPDV|nr:hypothetical protein SDRG_04849 [Saprolegnia diclina VS20]EQC37825.1 hypothetical protein SDRG_04849 [Saprolegnia diclina VS20]|eukprot:XP_008608758.1 hypothetical protein SDRG_04849 [Saprolegnia diclina VS20]
MVSAPPTSATTKTVTTTTVPEGMKVDANNLVVGQWKAGIFDCFTDVMPNCCMAYWCPCVSLAQIVHRIGFGAYATALVLFGLVYTATYASSVVAGQYATYTSQGNVYDSDNRGWAIASTSTALACGICVMIVRNIVRTKLQIPGNCLVDCLCGFFCNCCAIAQMATQVHAYDKGTCAFGPKDTLPGYMV